MSSQQSVAPPEDKIERNVEQSVKLGWSPSDFGAASFDGELVRAVELFQEERMMRPTGIADWRTYKALLAYRAALKEAERDRQRRANLSGLGSVSRLPADHPRVVASVAFTGVGLLVDRDANPAFVARLLRCGKVDHLIIPRGHPELSHMARLATETGRRLSIAAGSFYGMKTALSRVPEAATVTGLVVALPGGRGWIQAVHAGKARKALVDLRELDVPLALLMPPWCPRWDLTVVEKRVWLSMLDLADVYMPRVPGSARGYAPEYWMGVCFSEWSIALGRMPSIARWVFPMYEPETGDADHVRRFRAYMKNRGVRGYGFSKLPNDAGRGPYFGDLPVRIRRIDDVTPADRPW